MTLWDVGLVAIGIAVGLPGGFFIGLWIVSRAMNAGFGRGLGW